MQAEQLPTLTLSCRAARSTDVLFSDIQGEGVLLDQRRGRYYGLDEVGTRIWSMLGDLSLGQVRDALASEYEVDATIVWTDLTVLVTELASHDLVRVSAG
jgi:hypothetical protein